MEDEKSKTYLILIKIPFYLSLPIAILLLIASISGKVVVGIFVSTFYIVVLVLGYSILNSGHIDEVAANNLVLRDRRGERVVACSREILAAINQGLWVTNSHPIFLVIKKTGLLPIKIYWVISNEAIDVWLKNNEVRRYFFT